MSSSSPPLLATSLTSLLGVRHPVMLAGMDQVAGPELAAAVSRAGGFGVVGGARYTPDQLRALLAETRAGLSRHGDNDPAAAAAAAATLPFGVDLLLPQVGGGARKTNYDYTKGQLGQLLDVVIESGARLFVSAVGVPPVWAVEKLHKAGVLYMHVHKACQAGADLICAQGGEAGGHTGDIPTSILTPACADIVKQYTSPLTGRPVVLVAGGGVNDGRSLAAALMLGASGVWVGTRFIASAESKYPDHAKQQVLDADYDSWVRSHIWTGRPLRALRTPYVAAWETGRRAEMEALLARGVLPVDHDLDRLHREGKLTDEIAEQAAMRPIGIVAGAITKPNQTAAEIVSEIVEQAAELLGGAKSLVVGGSKL